MESLESDTDETSVQAGAVLMPLAMFLLSLKSIRVLSIMKVSFIYIKSLRRKDLFTCIYCCIMWLTRTSRKKKIDSSRICSSVYIISKKKRPVYMHIVIYIVIW